MRLPAPLLRRDPHAHKNHFGHVLMLAGSPGFLGAAALTGLAAMRSGAGLVTMAVAESLNLSLQEKVSPVIMTLPLPGGSNHSLGLPAYQQIKKALGGFQAMAVGPGLGHEAALAKVVLRVIRECPIPLVVDARALSILATDMKALSQAKGPRVLTPHLGEMRSMTGLTIDKIEKDRIGTAKVFTKKYNCILVLKGHNSVVASPKKVYVNHTGNAGMATAGSGDVLTGMTAAFLAQDIEPFEAAKTACYLHGKAGDIAAKRKGKVAMIASDIIDAIADAIGKK
jgi:hydroxyethylthiazole kinase-like uncharacterized protein yjeF